MLVVIQLLNKIQNYVHVNPLKCTLLPSYNIVEFDDPVTMHLITPNHTLNDPVTVDQNTH